jgi:hypothetical protein
MLFNKAISNPLPILTIALVYRAILARVFTIIITFGQFRFTDAREKQTAA